MCTESRAIAYNAQEFASADFFWVQSSLSKSEIHKATVIYRGADASQKLIECLLEEKKQIDAILENIDPLKMSEKDEETFAKATHCCMCRKAFGPNDTKVRHHEHFYIPECNGQSVNTAGNFKGACHNRCNLLAKKARVVPCILHNLKHFDGHILMQTLGLFRK